MEPAFPPAGAPSPASQPKYGIADTPTRGKTPRVFLFRSIPLLVGAAAFLAYAPSLGFGFVYDDRVQIVNNPWLESWQHLSQFFSQHTSAFTGASGGAYWRPLFLIWMLINRSLFGLAPWGWHLTTVALHSLAAVLVYFIAQRLLRDRLLAGFAALLFAFYPTTIETAAWISGSTDSLMAVLLLSAFLVYLRSWEKQSRHIRAFSLLLFALALLAKETAMILPLLVLAHASLYRSELEENLSYLGRSRAAGVLRSFLPYAAFAAIYLAERALVLSAGQPSPTPTSIGAMLLTWPALLWFYARLLLFPVSVSPHYDLGVVSEFGLGTVLLPSLALVALALAVGFGVRYLSRTARFSASTGRVIRFALLWMALPVLPVLYIRPLAPDDFAHVRYLYLSTVGLGLLAAAVIGSIPDWGRRTLGRPTPQAAAAVALLCASALATAGMQFYWRDNYTLFAHAARVAPRNARALTNYAIELGERRRYDEAIAQFEEAIRLNPGLWYAHVDLGYTYYLTGRYDEAERYMLQGIELNPDEAKQYTFLAAAQIRAGRLDKAEQSMRRAIERAPGMPSYHYALGLILEQQGRLEEAREAFRRELEIDPGNEQARTKLSEEVPQ